MKGACVMLYQRIKTEYERLCNQIASVKHEMKDLPPGKLTCCHHKNSSKWYQSDGHQRIYIPKDNRLLAEQLARKKYLSKLLEDLENEKVALSFYLRHHSPSGKAEELLTSPSEYQQLLLPYFKPLSQELSDWMNSPYEHSKSHPENLIYKGVDNTLLRSKSEVLIDMLLRTHNIPYRYECALHLGDSILYPDFTIRHPQTGAFYYWEHFGLMDNPSYVENVLAKQRLYALNDIIPGINLIITYETKNNPLSPEVVEKQIEFYFL